MRSLRVSPLPLLLERDMLGTLHPSKDAEGSRSSSGRAPKKEQAP